MKNFMTLSLMLSLGVSCAASDANHQISNDEYDRLYMANKEFEICDSDSNGVLEIIDLEGIKNLGSRYFCKRLLNTIDTKSISREDYILKYKTPEIKIDADRISNIVYKIADDQRVMMDLYLPKKDDRCEGMIPVVLFFHGGGWRNGDKYIVNGKGCQPIVDNLVKRGIAVASVNYRFIIDGKRYVPSVVSDAKDAVAFLHRDGAKYGIDGTKSVVWGGSAGGHLSLMCGFTDVDSFEGDPKLKEWRRKPAGVVSWYGSGDFTLGSWEDAIKRGHQTFYRCFTDSKETEVLREKGFESAPLTHISSDDPHTILFGGDADKIVSINDAKQMYAKLQKCGVESEIIVVHGAGHGWSGKNFTPNKEEINKLTYDSILKILKM